MKVLGNITSLQIDQDGLVYDSFTLNSIVDRAAENDARSSGDVSCHSDSRSCPYDHKHGRAVTSQGLYNKSATIGMLF
jgi:hypothetical protein